ncbi:acyl-CoA dehydrogenase family protein [Parahaliea aestuarii]|uniref:Acyl-CoA dehydrogenase n=1 Tax=Parahaliea aestuarii TaxID=1852021 RepID=A0A5C9A0U1_9GAMM|nr:acyl-CoA dehydrogenase family protein [Parahaliea aestuarii]TXS94483.1 acyl-CoA dehydrogenase [Parahaliea aestuarii]
MTAQEAAPGGDALEVFRRDVQAWLQENFPQELAGQDNPLAAIEGNAPASPAAQAWKAAIGSRGWGTPTWPREYGGGGLDHRQAKILNEEMAAVGAWNPIGGMGVMMLGPTLLEFASEEQKRRHIPPICRSEIRWCQGYSEPGAGSDLAALQTRAEDCGDHYLINGQKTWTSGGQWADWCFALVRTDKQRKHDGISFLLIDMQSPGVEVRPIQLISGTSPFCETFFTDVRVPKENLVGEENGGWTIGKRLLQHERTNLSGGAAGRGGRGGGSLAKIGEYYLGKNDAGQLPDADLRTRIARFEMRQRAFRLTAQRVLAEARSGAPAAASSILKNVGAELTQERAELTLEMMGLNGLGWEGDGFTPQELMATRGWLWGKAVSIYGGTAEIQNNVIAKRILGMQGE